MRHYSCYRCASQVQPQFRIHDWREWDADADGEHDSSGGLGAAEPGAGSVLRHAVAVVWANAGGRELPVAEQKTAELAAGLPPVVGTSLARGLQQHLIIWW